MLFFLMVLDGFILVLKNFLIGGWRYVGRFVMNYGFC